jgi:hypothetical protein
MGPGLVRIAHGCCPQPRSLINVLAASTKQAHLGESMNNPGKGLRYQRRKGSPKGLRYQRREGSPE